MSDSASARSRWPYLHRAYPSGLCQWDGSEWPEPDVLTLGGHGPGLGFEDQIRRTKLLGKLPAIILRRRFGRRHVLGIPERRSRIYPPDNGRDLLAGKRNIVLEVLNPDRLVD